MRLYASRQAVRGFGGVAEQSVPPRSSQAILGPISVSGHTLYLIYSAH